MKKRLIKYISVIMAVALIMCSNGGYTFAAEISDEVMAEAAEGVDTDVTEAEDITVDVGSDESAGIQEDLSEESEDGSGEEPAVTDEPESPATVDDQNQETAGEPVETVDEMNDETGDLSDDVLETENEEPQEEDELLDEPEWTAFKNNNKAFWRLEGDTLYIKGTGKVVRGEKTKKGKYINPVPWAKPNEGSEYTDDNVKKLVIDEGITEIAGYFMDHSRLEDVTLPSTLKTIGEDSFSGCYYEGDEGEEDTGLGSITIPNGVTVIGNSAFFGCGLLKRVDIPDSVTNIGDFAFTSCDALESVDLPTSLISISNFAFSNSGLKKVAIPPTVTTIGEGAFSSCFYLTELTIPLSVKTMGENLLQSHEQLMGNKVTVYFAGTEEQWKKIKNWKKVEETPKVEVDFKDPSESVESVTVTPVTTDLYLDEYLELKTTVVPAAADQRVYWTTSNKNVATVYGGEDGKGIVTPHSNGTVKITAYAADGSGKSATCTVTVKTHVKEVHLTAASTRVTPGKTLTIKPVFNEDKSVPTDKTLYWWSSDSAIATVNQKGVVTGKSTGTAKIKAVSAESSVESDELEIRVYEPLTSVKLDKTSFSLGEREKFTLTATLTPNEKNDDDEHMGVSFECADAAVNVEDKGDGTATVTAKNDVLSDKVKKKTVKVIARAKDGSGKSATCTVTIGNGVNNVTISAPKGQTTLAKGSTLKLSAGITPTNAINKTVEWTSSAPGVATVDKNGTVKALSAGNVKITAKSVSDTEKNATYDITTYVALTKAALDVSSLTLQCGKTYTLSPVITPADATDVTTTFRVKSGIDYVSVDESTGEIRAKDAGALGTKASQKAVIEMTVQGYDGTKKTATCSVTVLKDIVKVSTVKVSQTSLAMGSGSSAKLSAFVTPATADNKAVHWESDDTSEKVIHIQTNSDGTVSITANGNGKAKVTAVSDDDNKRKATCTVTVGNPVAEVEISAKTTRVIVGKTLTISSKVTGFGGNAANKTLVWSSTDESVATVSAKGVVTAKSAGTAKIWATAENGKKSKEIEITAYVPVSKIAVDRTSATVPEGVVGSFKIVQLLPENATDKHINWKSSNPSVVKIAMVPVGELANIASLADTATTGEGEVLGYWAVGPGTATITGTTNDGSKKTVKISIKVIGKMKKGDVGLDVKSIPKDVVVKEGTRGTKELKITQMPIKKSVTLKPVVTATAADKSVTFRSDNPSVAAVSSSGVISAKSPGTARITMRTSDGGFTATCEVTVPEK